MKRTRTNFSGIRGSSFTSVLRHLFFQFILFPIAAAGFAQSLPIGTPVLEELWRRMQISGDDDINVSFSIRPLSSQLNGFDSLYRPLADSSDRVISRPLYQKGKKLLRMLPLTISQQYASSHPYGWNDGAMIPARGYQLHVTGGFYGRIGPLTMQIQPELVYAENKDFPVFPASHTDSIWKSYYYILNRIDAPEKFGNKPYLRLFPGQSSIRLNHRKLSFGISSENLWWGPGIRNSLMMSNNAPGFMHLSFNTTAPLLTGIGSFEWQVVAGKLNNSDVISFDTSRTLNGSPLYQPKLNDDRYLNGMIITWQPRWTRGLHLGIQRVFYQYESHRASSLDGYLPVFSRLFKKNVSGEFIHGRDQLLSIFLRMIMPQSKAEFYVEYGRNDHSQDLIDLVLEPEHARAYLVGARKLFDLLNEGDLELYAELTHMQNPPTSSLRALEGWYTHFQVRHGYTHEGQVLGAGIGSGGNSQTAGFNLVKGYRKFGVMAERVVHNNDFYYDAFKSRMDFGSHWVDLSLHIHKQWVQKRFLYMAKAGLIRSLNYQWQHNADKSNLVMQFSASYLF